MIKIVLCDDSTAFLVKARGIVEKYAKKQEIEIQIDCFETVGSLEAFMESSQMEVDLMFLDIEMGSEKNGIDIAKKVNRIFPKCKIIFLTNYLFYATDVYETKHCYFVIKPEFEQRLPRLFEATFVGEANEKKISVSVSGKTIVYQMSDILYVERGRRNCTIADIHGRQKVSTYFDRVCELLTENCFVRCHNSFMVNLNEVHIMSMDRLTMKDGTEIPISRRYRDHVKQSFLKWQEEWV